MTGFGAEMRHINNRGWVIGYHAQHLTRGKGLKPPAGLQHGQGAQQPGGIKFGVMAHPLRLGPMFHLVNNSVTRR